MVKESERIFNECWRLRRMSNRVPSPKHSECTEYLFCYFPNSFFWHYDANFIGFYFRWEAKTDHSTIVGLWWSWCWQCNSRRRNIDLRSRTSRYRQFTSNHQCFQGNWRESRQPIEPRRGKSLCMVNLQLFYVLSVCFYILHPSKKIITSKVLFQFKIKWKSHGNESISQAMRSVFFPPKIIK